MRRRAPRLPLRWRALRARGALRMSVLVAVLVGAPVAALAQEIASAEYREPTREYPHGVLGDTIEWKRVAVTISGGKTVVFEAGENSVFEDTAPRLWDVTGDGLPEVVVVESHQSYGARLRILALAGDSLEVLAQTLHIGQRFRWLAPVGAVDLDGDGAIEVAFVDRPHLAKTLRVWRYRNGELSEIASLRGVSNHRIGEDFITGGLRDCGAGPEMIMADADWSDVVAARIEGGKVVARSLGRFSAAAVTAALACGG